MELLTLSFFYYVTTATVVCLLLAALACLWPTFSGFGTAFVRNFSLAVFAFSMLGFVSGSIMADSREPAVAAVLPAVLTLMGGVAAFHIGSKGVENQVTVCALVLVFSFALYVGSFHGSEVRGQNDLYVARDIEIEKNRYTLDLQRLDDYVKLVKLKRDAEALDLSRFESNLERKTDDRNSDDILERLKAVEK
jgi:hypothetical protein